MKTLHWEIFARANSRRVQYSMKDMIGSLERAGCRVEREGTSLILRVYKDVPEGSNPLDIRQEVTDAITRVHSRAARIFKGLV